MYQCQNIELDKMSGAILWLLFTVFLFPSIAAVVIPEVTVYRELEIPNSRQFISLGGLFPIRRNDGGQCGVLREAGVQRAEAMVFAIRTINEDVSILPKVNLTFDIRDTCSTPNYALERSIEYVQNSDLVCTNETEIAVSGIVGASSSSVSVAVASFFRLFQIPQISYASTATVLSDNSTFDYFFRTIPSDALQARAMADLIEHFNWTYIFALHSDNTYGRDGINKLIEILVDRNDASRCIALEASLPVGSSDNKPFDEVVSQMRKDWVRNASVAVLFGHVEEAIGMMDAITRADDDVLKSITWIASDSWALSLPKDYHERARGMLSILPHTGNLEDFKRYFTTLTPENNINANPWFDQYWELVSNCSLTDGSACSYDLSNVKINSKVNEVIDAIYAFAHAIHQMIEDHCDNGIVCDKIVTTRSIGEAIDGRMLRDYLYNVTFNSTFSSGRLFNGNGDVEGSYLIKNLKNSSDNQLSFETVGEWRHVHPGLQLTNQIEWHDRSNEPPQSVCSLPCEVGFEPKHIPEGGRCCSRCDHCPSDKPVSSGENCHECEDKDHMPNPERSGCVVIPVTYFTWSSPWAIVILLLTCVGICATVIVAVMFALLYKNPVIKASSRELSAILLAGILLCYILPFFFMTEPSPALCGVRRFAVGFCFAISYSALLVRSNRIHRIFNQSPGSPPRFIGTLSQVVITGILISIQVLIAVVWLAVDHPSVKTEQLDSTTVELRCGESPYIGISVSLIYNSFLLVPSTYFAFMTRNVPDNFNEAKFINVTVYSLCFIWIMLLPTYFITIRFGTVYENFFLLLAIFLSASTTLLCLLISKIVLILWHKKQAKERGGELESRFTIEINLNSSQ